MKEVLKFLLIRQVFSKKMLQISIFQYILVLNMQFLLIIFEGMHFQVERRKITIIAINSTEKFGYIHKYIQPRK